jgi:hypothetical protein
MIALFTVTADITSNPIFHAHYVNQVQGYEMREVEQWKHALHFGIYL